MQPSKNLRGAADAVSSLPNSRAPDVRSDGVGVSTSSDRSLVLDDVCRQLPSPTLGTRSALKHDDVDDQRCDHGDDDRDEEDDRIDPRLAAQQQRAATTNSTSLRIQPPSTIPKKIGDVDRPPYQRLAIRMLSGGDAPGRRADSATPSEAAHESRHSGDEEADDAADDGEDAGRRSPDHIRAGAQDRRAARGLGTHRAASRVAGRRWCDDGGLRRREGSRVTTRQAATPTTPKATPMQVLPRPVLLRADVHEQDGEADDGRPRVEDEDRVAVASGPCPASGGAGACDRARTATCRRSCDG